MTLPGRNGAQDEREPTTAFRTPPPLVLLARVVDAGQRTLLDSVATCARPLSLQEERTMSQDIALPAQPTGTPPGQIQVAFWYDYV